MLYTVQIHNGEFPTPEYTVEANSAVEAARNLAQGNMCVVEGKPGPLSKCEWFAQTEEGLFTLVPDKTRKFSMVRGSKI